VAKVTSIVRGHARALGVVIAVAATAALVASPAAFGAADPVSSGTFKLKLSSGFKKQLKSNGVKMKPKKFKVNGGTFDPTTGAGTLNLKGKLTFKKGGKKVVYKKLTAKIGKGGSLKGKTGKVFKLKGGKVTRSGFGAKVTGVKAKFLKSAAKKINKKLGLHSLHQGSAGKASASEQPSTVTLVSGTSELTPNIATFTKFGAHCVDPLGTSPVSNGSPGIHPIAPATANTATTPPSTDFPITGGSLSTAATSGTINSGGGIEITKNIIMATGATSPRCDQLPAADLKQTDLVLDLTTKQVQAHVVISGAGNPAVNGDKGTAFIATLDLTGATVTADPVTRKITITNASAAFNATSALVLNGAFPCNGDSGFSPTSGCTGPNAFVSGDPIGTVSVSGQAQ
jgi:hypothetical protein